MHSSTALALAALLTWASPAVGQAAPQFAQLYSYQVLSPPAFIEGYRTHLRWHEAVGDTLVWYGWTVASGPRRGMFVDGTFGVTLEQLDRRPQLAADRDDFIRNVAQHVRPVDVETWELWRGPTGDTPLEDRKPGAVMDVFVIDVEPARVAAFERVLGQPSARGPHGWTWYRAVRSGSATEFMLLVNRAKWDDLSPIGATFTELLRRGYGPTRAAAALSQMRGVRSEVWSYEPRLSLLPGVTLAP
ncbi:hypothetical protein FPZ24_03835 [Sphingomonas panacisoli]|uniref:NIPSNAP domain-containing protein n=1 Tax=Sphingomonas panacisoli TaxID=1813879 RepID=A0A5B8LFJ4_9SPHN|nr:hypothetical protein [Sphingomonas panacisoli]QDZ06716.1 hypothetical protein FPZ24_03835 [Sphingomonas panacisoli]